MSIKLVVLKSGETIISDTKEIVKEEKETIVGYLLKEPYTVSIQRKILLVEEENHQNDGREVELVLTPWIPLSSDTEFVVSPDWVVCITNPDKSVLNVYEERING